MSENLTTNGDIASTLLLECSCDTSYAQGFSHEDLSKTLGVDARTELSVHGDAITRTTSTT